MAIGREEWIFCLGRGQEVERRKSDSGKAIGVREHGKHEGQERQRDMTKRNDKSVNWDQTYTCKATIRKPPRKDKETGKDTMKK